LYSNNFGLVIDLPKYPWADAPAINAEVAKISRNFSLCLIY
jgi:hypothetical protein